MVDKVLIVGGGIAGLTLGIALKRHGISPEIVEIQSEWQPSGSGITVPSNALRALRPLGVVEQIIARGWPMDDGLILNQHGKQLLRVNYPRIVPDLPAAVAIQRLELHRILVAAVRSVGVPVTLGTTISALHDEEGDTGVEVRLTTGKQGRYDLVVGADGVRSKVRSMIFPDAVATRSGFSIWRTFVKRPQSVTTRTLIFGVGKRIGLFPVSDDVLYLFGTAADPGRPRYDEGKLDRLMREKFAEFGGVVRELLSQITAPECVIFNALDEVYREPPWHRGRVVLLGDAVHASSPFLAQGGAMAIEDAIVLAELLASGKSPTDTLLAFATRRYERCNFVQIASRKNGEDAHNEDAALAAERDAKIPLHAQATLNLFYAKLAAPI